MLQHLPTVAFAPWTPSNKGASLGLGKFKMIPFPILRSSFNVLKLHFGHLYTNANGRRQGIFFCAYRSSYGHNLKKREILPQNMDLPTVLPRKKKKPYSIPLKKIQQAARVDKKLAEIGLRGLLSLQKMNECSEIHVAQIGWDIQDCRGPTGKHKTNHTWIKGSISDGLSNDGEDRERFPLQGYKWRLIISYDGTRFSGMQYQQSTPTIQCIVEEALTRITKLERDHLCLVGAGRTDAGVHAWGQVAHFITPFNYDNLEAIHKALNGLLPPDIRIREISSALPEFHARFSVKSKIYNYKIYNDTIMDPFHRHYAYHSVYKLNPAAMRVAAKHFIGEHDFSAFANASRNDRIPNPVKNIFRFDVNEMGPLLLLEVEGSGFLYRQVRNMVALLLQVGREAVPADIVPKILESRDRKELAKYALSVPPHGLCLFAVNYDEDHLLLPSGRPATSVGRHHSISKCKLSFY